MSDTTSPGAPGQGDDPDGDDDAKVDEELEETFPASDPPSTY